MQEQTVKERVIDCIPKGVQMSISDVVDASGCKYRNVKKELNSLTIDGHLQKQELPGKREPLYSKPFKFKGFF